MRSPQRLVRRFALFVLACVLPGLGGALGSILGHSGGQRMLWVGGFAGGLLASMLVAWVAAKARWIGPDRRLETAVGTAAGFLVAAAIAMKTLSSPVGPVLSTIFSGLGALVGSSWRVRRGRDVDVGG